MGSWISVECGTACLELDSCSTIRFNDLQFHPYLRVEPPSHLMASIHQPLFPAKELFNSLPHGLFENLEGLRVEGELAYDFELDAIWLVLTA